MKNAASMRRSVRQRASERCEYCDLAQSSFPLVSFHVEHVVAKQHGGSDYLDNLCLSCHWYYLFKGPNLSSLVEGKLTRLFNPRTDAWSDHFAAIGGRIQGLTEIGVATVSLLNMNDPDRVELRRLTTKS
ncbi:MAG: HNH endonuclease signature motif containing protein [Planctomycetota bacterium]|nr:HNH endonuclease signature motif containing protein [Planctomycetota bacterium]